MRLPKKGHIAKKDPAGHLTRAIELLHEITAETSRSSDLAEILNHSLPIVLKWLEVEQGGVYLFDERSRLLKVTASCGLPAASVEQIDGLKPGEGFIGQAAQIGEPLVLQDLMNDPRLTRLAVAEAGLHSVAVVPIQLKGRILGALFTITRGRREFQPIEVKLLALVGSQIGVVIENARLMADTQHRLAQLTALQETSRAVVSTLDLNALLDLIVRQATALLQADGGILNLVNLNQFEDQVVACCGTTRDTLANNIPLDRTLSGWVTLHNQPVIVNDVSKDPRAYQGQHITNVAVAPLTVKDRVIGTLVVADKLSGAADFEQPDLNLLVSFASQAAAAIENARLYAAEQRRAAMEERSRLARELHDAVSQTLFSASLIAEALPAAWEKDPQKGRELLQDLRGMSRGALAEMRTLLLELRPAALADTHLEDLLCQLGEAASGREGIPVKVLVEGKGTLPPEVHIALYRIAQEALNNVVKHAWASQATIRLCYPYRELAEGCQKQEERVLLSITDNGRGFDLTQAPHRRLGLGIMQERADAIGANLLINSHLGEGTQVTVIWERPLSSSGVPAAQPPVAEQSVVDTPPHLLRRDA